MNPQQCTMELTFNRQWKHVSVVRNFVQNFLTVNLTPSSSAMPDRVAMAVSELIENAVKYSLDDEVRVRLSLFSQPETGLKVTVENRAATESISVVQSTYERSMRGDSLETYLEMMRESAHRTESSSQLGLIRIRQESGCQLSLDITGDLVRFTLDYTEGA